MLKFNAVFFLDLVLTFVIDAAIAEHHHAEHSFGDLMLAPVSFIGRDFIFGIF